MASVPFDTLKAFKDLQEAGFDEAQAEAVIATVGQAFTGDLATKEDIREMATKADLHALEARLMVRLGGLMLGAAGLIVAAIRLLS